MTTNKINSLQLLRAIAVSLVIFIHASSFGVTKITSISPVDSFYNLKSWGNIGVDLFFGISGFIMTLVTPAYIKNGGYKTFFIKRIIRIVPLYYSLSLIDILVTVLVKHEGVSISAILKTLFFFPLFDRTLFEVPIITVGWSLSYEMYFYLLICILLILKENIYKRLLLLITVLSIAGLLINPSNPLLRFLSSPILLEFGLGIICGLLYKKIQNGNVLRKGKLTSVVLIIIGMVSMAFTIFLKTGFNLDPSTVENNNVIAFYRFIIWGMPSAVFMLGIILLERYYRVKIPNVLILSGDASYSCYLIHTLILSITAVVFKCLSLSSNLYLLLIVPICLAGSIFFYELIEKPLNAIFDRVYKYRKPILAT